MGLLGSKQQKNNTNKPPQPQMDSYNNQQQYEVQGNYQTTNNTNNVSQPPQMVSYISQQQQEVQDNYKNYHQSPVQRSSIRLLNDKAEDKDKKVVAVIVTLCTSTSYDHLFTSVEQKSMEGTKVEVYACDSFYLQSLAKAFEGKPKDDVAIKLMDSIKKVDPDCVVFNWECCGGYSGETFVEGNDKLFKFVKKVIEKGHMCMFSDFSLKALVKNWNVQYGLGPNPFQKTSEHTGQFEIRFNSGELKECPSAQLQIVGDMAEGGKCNIQAASGTIVYCVDSSVPNHNFYKLQVLTVVSSIPAPQNKLKSKIGSFEGSAGHVLLKYPSGGMILTSMGHWVELMKIDTTEKKLFEVAQNMFGSAEVSRMKAEYEQMDVSEQQAYVETKGRDFVRNQAPCNNMYKKSAW